VFSGAPPTVSFSITGGRLVVDGLVQFDGNFSFEHRNDDLMLANGPIATPLNDVGYTLISGVDLSGFVGINGPWVDAVATPNAFGLSLSDVDFTLLLLSHDGVDYTALKANGDSAGFVGTSAFVVEVSAFNVELNLTSDDANPGRVLDFNDGTDDSVAGIAVVPLLVGATSLDSEGEDGALRRVAGSAAIDVFGALVAVGAVEIQLGTLTIDDGGIVPFSADALSLSVNSASLFVGVGPVNANKDEIPPRRQRA
jgi:hypothetical protein